MYHMVHVKGFLVRIILIVLVCIVQKMFKFGMQIEIHIYIYIQYGLRSQPVPLGRREKKEIKINAIISTFRKANCKHVYRLSGERADGFILKGDKHGGSRCYVYLFPYHAKTTLLNNKKMTKSDYSVISYLWSHIKKM